MTPDNLFGLPVHGMPTAQRQAALLDVLNGLTAHHRAACPDYDRMLTAAGHTAATDTAAAPTAATATQATPATRLADVPWLPVGLFKRRRLASVPPEQVLRVLTSSGTTGSARSQIVLDAPTAQRQAAALAAVMGTLLGPRRLPLLIVDAPSTARGGSARSAGVLGMLPLGRRPVYVLNEQLELQHDVLDAFLGEVAGGPFIVFGFTWLVWTRLAHCGRDFSGGVLVHGGGWKALADQAVDAATFAGVLRGERGFREARSYYGMVEQVGGVHLEDADGLLQAPVFADVLVRHPRTLELQPDGEPGLLQVLSGLPTSYPGHSLLTEDLGVLEAPGRFRVLGRVPKAAARGCSDVLAAAA
jgi:hypothetical protein